MTNQLSQKEMKQFELISGIAKSEAGLSIPTEKASMVFSRLSKRIRELGLADMDAYCELLKTNKQPTERSELITRLTTNVTSFFRENHHFEFLKSEVLPQLLRSAEHGERIRIWSAGCSTGPEPYCLAMTLLDMHPRAAEMDVKILATDIDKEVLAKAKTGVYSDTQLSALSNEQKQKYFVSTSQDGMRSVGKVPRSLIKFNQLNLLHDWPMRMPFHVIFCRNVLIYFDQQTQDNIVGRFAERLMPDGLLMLGHSERVSSVVSTNFQTLGNTMYRRVTNSPSEGARKWH